MSLIKHLITEGKEDVIRNKIGLDGALAHILVNRYKGYKKYWIPIAHITTQAGNNVFVFNEVMTLFSRIVGMRSLPNPPAINFKEWKRDINTVNKINAYNSALSGIIDYMQGVQPSPDLSNATFEEAKEIADAWHYAIARGEDVGSTLELEEGQVVVHTYDDGYYWVDLKTNDCTDEGNAMGHCGRTRADTLLSLRDSKGEPHVTIAYNYSVSGNDYAGEARQIKGKGNKKPVEKYHEYIYDLILNSYTVDDIEYRITHITPEYRSEDDFNIFDGTQEQIKEVVNKLGSRFVHFTTVASFDNPKTMEFYTENPDLFVQVFYEFNWRFPDSPPYKRVVSWEMYYNKSEHQFYVLTENLNGFLVDQAPDNMTDDIDNAFVKQDDAVINDALGRILDAELSDVEETNDGYTIAIPTPHAIKMILHYNGLISDDPMAWE